MLRLVRPASGGSPHLSETVGSRLSGLLMAVHSQRQFGPQAWVEAYQRAPRGVKRVAGREESSNLVKEPDLFYL